MTTLYIIICIAINIYALYMILPKLAGYSAK